MNDLIGTEHKLYVYYCTVDWEYLKLFACDISNISYWIQFINRCDIQLISFRYSSSPYYTLTLTLCTDIDRHRHRHRDRQWTVDSVQHSTVQTHRYSR